jgi:hypothetical protein
LTAGSKSLDVASSVTTAKEFQLGGDCTATLKPHGRCDLNVAFRPLAEGARQGVLTISGKAVTLTSTLKGTGNPVAPVLTPPATDFGTVAVRRSSVPQTFKLTAGSRALPAPTLSTRSKEFVITREGCTTTLPAFAGCTFDVVFRPAAFGRRTAMLSVTSSPPLAATLRGFGWATATWSASPTSLTLYVDRSNPTDTGTVAINVAATSLAPLLSPRIALSGSDYFHQSSDCRPTMLAGSTCTVTVKFTLAGPLTDPKKVATLTVSSRNGGRKTINLYGAFIVE